METPCNSNIWVLAQVLGDAGQLTNAFRIITATITVRLMGDEVNPQASHPALEKWEWLLQSRLLLGENELKATMCSRSDVKICYQSVSTPYSLVPKTVSQFHTFL